jgi:hypothetical protein
MAPGLIKQGFAGDKFAWCPGKTQKYLYRLG